MFNQYDSFNKEEKDKQKNINIIEKIKIIFDEFKNNPNENIQKILIYIDNLFLKTRINVKLNFNDIINISEQNEKESIIEKINKDIQKIQNELQIEKNNSLNIINNENKRIELGNIRKTKENDKIGITLSSDKKEKKLIGKKGQEKKRK